MSEVDISKISVRDGDTVLVRCEVPLPSSTVEHLVGNVQAQFHSAGIDVNVVFVIGPFELTVVTDADAERRDMFAAAALTGLCARSGGVEWASKAVEFADAVIAELDRERP